MINYTNSKLANILMYNRSNWGEVSVTEVAVIVRNKGVCPHLKCYVGKCRACIPGVFTM